MSREIPIAGGSMAVTGHAPKPIQGLILDVHVLGHKVGSLYGERGDYVFQYDPAVAAQHFVSLAMPVRRDPWVWPRALHPYFRQNLPEGFLLSIIREDFGRLLDGTDLSVLAVVGSATIGRVSVTLHGQPAGAPLDSFDVSSVLHGDNSKEHFASLVRHYARAAISGAVPKFLAPEALADVDAAALAPVPLGKTSMRTGRFIVKGSDDNAPFLGFNEHHSMRLIERLNAFPVAKTRMSDDGQALVVERFDVDENGVPACGVEDMCGLLGLSPDEKYNPTTEQIVKAARAYFSAEAWLEQSRRLGWLILSTYVVRNADCHAKNIALLYTDANDVQFSPAYNMVTTQAYPRYAKNPPALSIDGRKTWAPGKTLERFFATRLGIPGAEYTRMVQALCDAAVQTCNEVAVEAKANPQWRDVAKNMTHAWNEGTQALRSTKPNVAFHALQPVIDQEQFSPPDKAPPEDLAASRSDSLDELSRKCCETGEVERLRQAQHESLVTSWVHRDQWRTGRIT
jgi:serine/threonine-protein kinase HipA